MDNTKLEKTFFGQPRGLSTLFFTEMWERFSYYGMRAILIYYMYYAVSQGGLGMDEITAASVMSIYGTLVYLSGIIGGWVADRVWGPRSTVFIGGVLIIIGHIILSMPMGFLALYVSIAFIVLGTGLLKPNVSNMVGGLYSIEDRRRDAGFSIFFFGINLGSAIAPWLVPWASEGFGLNLFGNTLNFHAGFSLAAVGMVIGLIQYHFGSKKYLSDDGLAASDPISKEEMHVIVKKTCYVLLVIAIILGLLAAFNQFNISNIILLITIVAIALPIYYFVIMLKSPKVNKKEHSNVLTAIPLFLAATIFWAIEESGSVVLALFAEQRTILQIGSWHFSAANFQTLNPVFIMLLTPFFVWLWENWKGQPSASGKFAIGLVIAGISYMVMAVPGILYGTSGKVSPFWLIGSWFIVEIAEMLIGPIGLAVTSKLAPKAFKSQMMSIWFLANATGQAINSQIIKYYRPDTEIQYFLIVGGVSVLFGIIMIIFTKKINGLVGEEN